MFDTYFSQELKKDEKLVSMYRKHWATFIVPMLKVTGVLIIPFFLIFFLFASLWGVIIFFVWVIAGIGYGIYQWLTWYFDSFIITDKRLINIDQKGLFHRTVSEANIVSVQDITYEMKGVLASAFNFGTLKIATASKNSMDVKGLENPKAVQELIFDLREKSDKILSAQELVEMLEKSKKL